jgi:acetyl-CoA synthetase
MAEHESGELIYDIPAAVNGQAAIDPDTYEQMYQRSIQDPEGFWAEQADTFVSWFKKWDRVLEWDFHAAQTKWFLGGKLNVSYNCLDRHVEAGAGQQTALIWQGNDAAESLQLSYAELLDQVCRFANALKALGVTKGDRVCIYMQMIPELAVAMLACTRIGAVHSIVFGAFSPDSLRDRIQDSSCKVLITQDTGLRGAKTDIPMKANADAAVADCPSIKNVVVVQRTGHAVAMQTGRDVWWHELVAEQSEDCPPEHMDAEDPLFILYTSGSTGKPKGVLHTTGGYLVYASITHKYVFDYRPGDTYWCTADIGWVTGHSYIVYGPLSNRATTMMFEGVPNYPDFGRFWQIVEQHKVNIFYTAPTALRALMKEGDSWPAQYDLSSLRILGTVGEPIKSPEWHWYYRTIGQERCPIVDTWWQTETGGFMITPTPVVALKPGSATLPFTGIEADVVREDGSTCEPNEDGYLVIKRPWPGMARTVWGDPDRYVEQYWSEFAQQGWYFTGDSARRDDDGYFWIIGRMDDVIKVSGYRLGTVEIESALVSHPDVAEAACVGIPHELRGNVIHAFCILNEGVSGSSELIDALKLHVRHEVGPIAVPAELNIVDGLPKTRSGKIMRRLLKAQVQGLPIGDVSTLAD